MRDRAGLSLRDLPAAVLFDIGMTLIYPSGDVMVRILDEVVPGHSIMADEAARALAIAAETHHYKIDPSTDPTEIVGVMWGHLLGLPDGCGITAWKACTQTLDLYSVLDPDAEGVVSELRSRGVKTAAVSNATNSLREELASFNLLHLFDMTIGSNEGYREKPCPDMFYAAIAGLGIPPERCWFVGDGLINDVLGAARAQIEIQILVDRYDIYTAPPCFHIRSMSDLRRIVRSL